MGYISNVCSGGQSWAVLADQNVMGFISAIHELASRERQFYCWLSRVRKLLLTPIRCQGDRVSVLLPSLTTTVVMLLTLHLPLTNLSGFFISYLYLTFQSKLHRMQYKIFFEIMNASMKNMECLCVFIFVCSPPQRVWVSH